jgi:hypothetical protein
MGDADYVTAEKVALPIGKTELVLLVGLSGAGKSTYYKNTLQQLGYMRVSQQDGGDSEKHMQAAEQHILAGKSVRSLLLFALPDLLLYLTVIAGSHRSVFAIDESLDFNGEAI